jgi:hypothetical protein
MRSRCSIQPQDPGWGPQNPSIVCHLVDKAQCGRLAHSAPARTPLSPPAHAASLQETRSLPIPCFSKQTESPRPRTSKPQTWCTASLHTISGALPASQATPAARAASTASVFLQPHAPLHPAWALVSIHGSFQQRDEPFQVSKTHLLSKSPRRFRSFSLRSCTLGVPVARG